MLEFLGHPHLLSFDFDLSSWGINVWVCTLIVGIIRWGRLSAGQRRLIAFVTYTLGMEILASSNYTKFLFHETSNSPWYYLLTPGLFYLYVRIVGPVLFGSRWPVVSVCLLVAITCVAIMDALVWDGFYRFPSILAGVYSMVGILWAVGYFMYLLQTLAIRKLERDPLFWMACGFIIYYSGNFLTWLSFNLVTYEVGFFEIVSGMGAVFTILLNCLLIISLLVKPRSTAQTLSPLAKLAGA